ncbi:MAG: hypothetical protein J6C33_00720 [Lachnospiraceae bacterium]|nr:hypothetical protein [Lachnospiraceae bacterium]
MNRPEWMNDPSLADVDQAKLDFLQTLVFESQNLSPKEMLSFLMNISKRGKDSSVSFTKDEMNRVIAVLKQRSTPDEIARIDKAVKLMQNRK